jgi:hypothetical protein
MDHPVRVNESSEHAFSNIFDRIQTGNLTVTCTTDHPVRGRRPSACAWKESILPIIASIG